MAQITRCDGGCGKESPENGLHHANTWIQMQTAVANAFRDEHARTDRIFCGVCWGRIEAAMRSPRSVITT